MPSAWRTSGMRYWRSTSTKRRSPRPPRAKSRSSSPAWSRCCASTWIPDGSGSPCLSRRSACLIVGKSTVPVGTARQVMSQVQAAAPAGQQVELAWNPEFLREGFAVQDSLAPDRIVLGVTSDRAQERMRQVYATTLQGGTPLLVMDLETAELVKVAANAFLATKISFINAMAEICEEAGADVIPLAEALGYDARIGRRFLSPGLGYGGGGPTPGGPGGPGPPPPR